LPEIVECPDCGERVKRRGLGVHRARAHGRKRPANGATRELGCE